MSLDLAPRPLPLRTASLPGTGGAAKVSPEDFLVEEIPAYLATGEGEHLYLWVEKRDLSTGDAARMLATALGANEREVGYAGQKDRKAITRQWFSVLTKAVAPVLEDPRLKVISSSRHGNKLRLGHLKGNRFTIVLRGVGPEAEDRARVILEALASGLPNFYGIQRFGRTGDNAAVGAALLGLGTHPEAARATRDRFLRRLVISALQSELFNRCLIARMADGLLDEAIKGDVLRKRESGGLFVCADPLVDSQRVKSGELDATGPMPGSKERTETSDEARIREDRVLEEAGVPRDAFAAAKGEAKGARRPYRVLVEDPRVRSLGPDSLELSFSLPAGAYATRVVAEVTKADIALPAEG